MEPAPSSRENEQGSLSTSSDFDEAATLLKTCFQFAGESVCAELASRQEKSLVRPWRPINPCVGASIDWRRCENLHWRLFWRAQQQRAAEEAEWKKWPNTPSSDEPYSDMYLGPDLNVGHGSISWHSIPFARCQSAPCDSVHSIPFAPSQWLTQYPTSSTELDRYPSCFATLLRDQQKLATRNAELEQRVAYLEQKSLREESAEQAASIRKLEERVQYLEELLRKQANGQC